MNEDAGKLAEMAERFGADNPAVILARFLCAAIDPIVRADSFWPDLMAMAKYMNEPVCKVAAGDMSNDAGTIGGVVEYEITGPCDCEQGHRRLVRTLHCPECQPKSGSM